ncbi:Organic cation transporter protein [Eumeta japonica]|uniref:Organic cation transporter protein n=1 Tax=Eumeta variegata TaxID=151549 RepID=A0A4C1WUY6_EUMVA|nr:Organic cation transporter protein [Eumeta japonica]
MDVKCNDQTDRRDRCKMDDGRNRCLVEECEASPPQWQAGAWAEWALPPDPACWRRPRRLDNATCAPDQFDLDSVEACQSWIYREHYSIVAEFELACEQWRRTLVGTVHSAGLLVALPITGYVSDSFLPEESLSDFAHMYTGTRTRALNLLSVPLTTPSRDGSIHPSTLSFPPQNLNIPSSSYSPYSYSLPAPSHACYSHQNSKNTLFVEIKKRSEVLQAALCRDRFGRRTALVATAMSAGVVGLARSWSPNYITYLILEFLDATLGSGVYSTGFILALETVGPKRRVLGGSIISCTYALGQVALALVARFVPYWRDLTRVLYTPSLLFFVYYFLLYESIRWLLSKGRRREAARVLQRAAAVNGRTISKETLRRLDDQADEDVQSQTPAHGVSGTPKTKEKSKELSLAIQVIRSRVLMVRVCVCSFWWITTTFVYYGLSINSVSLAGDAYWNYALTSLVEIPGYLLGLITLDRFGRKRSIMVALWVCAVSLVALPFVIDAAEWAGTALTMLGKLCISMTFSSIYIYTSELFPTNARHSLLGACSMVGRIGSILAPQTPLLMEVMPSLPYLLFGVMAACSALLMLLTPETLNVTLPDTVDQAEAIKNPAPPVDGQLPHDPSRNSTSSRIQNRDNEMS